MYDSETVTENLIQHTVTDVCYIRSPNLFPTEIQRKHQDATENKPGARHDDVLYDWGKEERRRVHRKEEFFGIWNRIKY